MHVHASSRDIGISLGRYITIETMLTCWSNEVRLAVRRHVLFPTADAHPISCPMGPGDVLTRNISSFRDT